MVASTKSELLQAIAVSGGGDPYNMVSGIVRGVAVDRWCNELFADGFITGDGSIPYAEVTPNGKRWLYFYDIVQSGEPLTDEKMAGVGSVAS